MDGLDFENRILDIYQQCCTATEIETRFQELRESLSPQIDVRMQDIRRKLLENFDDKVTEKLRLNYNSSAVFLSRFDRMLWELTRYML